jgi:YebC/PmpR family DNA-binding regulatory protein
VAGHSKWKQIKHKKALTDSRRAAAWTKIIREITVAAKAGGGDPTGNPRLRLAIDTARAANMPNDNIERAIKKGTGELEGVHYEEITYEAYGPAGVAIMIDTLTDNANRTVADIRRWLSRNGGNLGTTGSVAWMFDRRGQIDVDAGRYDEETVMEAALEAGALDVEGDDGTFTVTTDVADFGAVQDALREKGIEWESAELAMVPKTEVRVEGDDAKKLVKLLELLEDLDDVQNVYTNADMDVDVDSLAEV